MLTILSDIKQGNSTRQISSNFEIPRTSLRRVLKSVLHLFPYRITLAQGLSDTDKLFRVESARYFQENLPENLNQFYFSDEATFRLDGLGGVNRWNCRIWAPARPENFITEKWQNSPRITVWAAMSATRLFGPYFFPGTVNADDYLVIIRDFFLKDVQQEMGLNCIPETMWFMQDGAPAHTAISTRDFLRKTFGPRVVSRYMPIEWPPRSPDLTPCDYFLWGFVKQTLFARGRSFDSIEELSTGIIEVFNDIRNNQMDHVTNAVNAFYDRLDHCTSLDGAQLTHR